MQSGAYENQGLPTSKLPLTALADRHPGLTKAIGDGSCEAASVCLSRHHEPPSDLVVDCDGNSSKCSAEWVAPDPRTKAAWANEIEATEAGAYGVSLAAIESYTASFPGSVHVELIGLRAEPDQTIWDYAGLHGLTIVSNSKDKDFRQMSFVKGPPPKVIWLSVGNAGTDAIARLLEKSVTSVTRFVADADESLLELDLSGNL